MLLLQSMEEMRHSWRQVGNLVWKVVYSHIFSRELVPNVFQHLGCNLPGAGSQPAAEPNAGPAASQTRRCEEAKRTSCRKSWWLARREAPLTRARIFMRILWHFARSTDLNSLLVSASPDLFHLRRIQKTTIWGSWSWNLVHAASMIR